MNNGVNMSFWINAFFYPGEKYAKVKLQNHMANQFWIYWESFILDQATISLAVDESSFLTTCLSTWIVPNTFKCAILTGTRWDRIVVLIWISPLINKWWWAFFSSVCWSISSLPQRSVYSLFSPILMEYYDFVVNLC